MSDIDDFLEMQYEDQFACDEFDFVHDEEDDCDDD